MTSLLLLISKYILKYMFNNITSSTLETGEDVLVGIVWTLKEKNLEKKVNRQNLA